MSLRKCVLFLFISVSVVQIFGRGHSPDCSLDVVSSNNERNLPILFYNYSTHFELAVPQKGHINLNAGDAITITCPGKKNYLTATNSNSTYSNCVGGTALRVVRRHLNFEDLQCKKDIRGDVIKTTKRCAEGEGHITEIGYQVTKNDWVALVKVCYNDSTGVTFYTEHVLHGKEIKYSAKRVDRPSFSTEGLGHQVAATLAYTRVFQKSTFDRLLGSSGLAERYINSRSYLARGHLSPAGDFLLATSKRSSYCFINVCPQWQTINGGNWKNVESNIRKTAKGYNRSFTIITGTYGILSLPDVNNNLQRLYLVSKDKLPIPEIIWKLIYDPQEQIGIAIIVMNNPFLTLVSQNDLLCENICRQYGWINENWNDASKGYVYCCELREFLKVVRTAPRLKDRGVLFASN